MECMAQDRGRRALRVQESAPFLLSQEVSGNLTDGACKCRVPTSAESYMYASLMSFFEPLLSNKSVTGGKAEIRINGHHKGIGDVLGSLQRS